MQERVEDEALRQFKEWVTPPAWPHHSERRFNTGDDALDQLKLDKAQEAYKEEVDKLPSFHREALIFVSNIEKLKQSKIAAPDTLTKCDQIISILDELRLSGDIEPGKATRLNALLDELANSPEAKFDTGFKKAEAAGRAFLVALAFIPLIIIAAIIAFCFIESPSSTAHNAATLSSNSGLEKPLIAPTNNHEKPGFFEGILNNIREFIDEAATVNSQNTKDFKRQLLQLKSQGEPHVEKSDEVEHTALLEEGNRAPSQ